MPTRAAPSVPGPRLRIAFLLAHRFTLCAFANFIDVLRLAADEGDRSRPILCRWRVLAPTRGPIESSTGVRIEPDGVLGDPREYDYVVVVGGLLRNAPQVAPASAAFLRRAAALGVPLVGLCTGSFILARAGLLDGYRACVSWFHHEEFVAEFAGPIAVSDRIFIVDRDRLTCSGGASAAHLAAFLVERHLGPGLARKSLSIMIIDEAFAGERPQPGLPLDLSTADALVRRALLHMQQNVETRLDVASLALRLGVTRRTLERRFRDAIGLSPAEARRRVRVALACHLLGSGGGRVSDVAAATGFADASHMIRAFRCETGTTPGAWRQARCGGAAAATRSAAARTAQSPGRP